MATKIAQLEERVARIEQKLEKLPFEPISSLDKGQVGEQQSWKRIVGNYAHDPTFAEIIRLGAEWRRQQREP